MAVSTLLSTITLNVNGLNVPIKRQRVAEWIKKTTYHAYAAHQRFTSDQKTHTDKQ